MTTREESAVRLPDDALLREIERREGEFAGPVERLRFVRASVEAYDSAPEIVRGGVGKLGPKMVIAEVNARLDGRRDMESVLLRAGYQGARALEKLQVALSSRKVVLGLGLAAVMAGVAAAPSMLREWSPSESAAGEQDLSLAVAPTQEIWLVESDEAGELYSNGLRISNEFVTHNQPRRYTWLPATLGPEAQASLDEPDWRSLPAGIVFHTTVTGTAPMLERRNNQLLRSHGEKLMRYLARERLYNFVIDRFGRVYRLVPEDEYAYHAGFSVWGDDQAGYVDLNESFLGVAFETRPEAVEPGVRPEAAVTEAQVESARRLTRVLRERYGILASNCVTHEMVSLSPDKRLLGYHTDWDGRFPFASLGLPDNYQSDLPAVSYWGFAPDGAFRSTMGAEMRSGVAASEKRFAADARARGVSKGELQRVRLRQYHALRARLKEVKQEDPEAARSH